MGNLATFYIRGTCVDDMFHILANNGYNVQVCTTTKLGIYRVDVIVKESEGK